MLNHSPEAKQCHVYDGLSGELSVLAGKSYEKGDQVDLSCFATRSCAYLEVSLQLFINYGPLANNRLLRLYGFVVPGNRNESYDLVLTTHPMAPFFEQKQKLWVSAGLDSTSTISLTLTDPLPRSVLRYLRIQRLNESDLAIIAPRQSDAAVEKISESNEVEVLRFLIESISDLLDGFGTQIEKLEEQLAEGFYSPGGNAWSAAHVSLGEQRVLRLTRKTAEDLLATVESGSGNERGLLSAPPQCAKCEKVSVQLMRCARCNKVAYCGRACQVAHYKEHKAMCRATASGIGSDRN
jgi:hypothetical protein